MTKAPLFISPTAKTLIPGPVTQARLIAGPVTQARPIVHPRLRVNGPRIYLGLPIYLFSTSSFIFTLTTNRHSILRDLF